MHPTYIALLRGINVSGQKKIKMAELREQLAGLPIENIQTYIQSGNIIFKTAEKDLKKIEAWIHDQIVADYGFEVPVMVLKPEEFKYVLDHNPFLQDSSIDPSRLYYTFLDQVPDPDLVNQIQASDYTPEAFQIDGKYLYFFSPKGYGRAKMNNNFFEKKLKVAATTRNTKTVQKLYELGTSQNKK